MIKEQSYFLVICLILLPLTGCIDLEDSDEELTEVKCDLVPNADCSHEDLSGMDLSGKDLSGIDFSFANLTWSDLSDTDLSGADLQYCFCDNASFENADLSDANMFSTFLIDTRMAGANLDDASLLSAFLIGTDLNGASLRKANLRNSFIIDVDLTNANLDNANLDTTNVGVVDFSNSTLIGTTFIGMVANSTKFINSNLQNSYFTSASLYYADFYNADLSGADFTYAYIETSNLTNATLYGSNLLSLAWAYTVCPDGVNTGALGSCTMSGICFECESDEEIIRNNIQQIGLENFPDDENTVWNITAIKFDRGYYWVETSPEPDVGYARVMFIMSGISQVVGVEVMEDGVWGLLFGYSPNEEPAVIMEPSWSLDNTTGEHILINEDGVHNNYTGELSGDAFHSNNHVVLTRAYSSLTGHLTYEIEPQNFVANFAFYAGDGYIGADATWLYAFCNSLAIQEDASCDGGYHFVFDEYTDEIQFWYDGSLLSSSNINYTFDNSEWHNVTVKYTDGYVEMYLENELVLNLQHDITNIVFDGKLFGFGARTGYYYNTHKVANILVTKEDESITAPEVTLCGIQCEGNAKDYEENLQGVRVITVKIDGESTWDESLEDFSFVLYDLNETILDYGEIAMQVIDGVATGIDLSYTSRAEAYWVLCEDGSKHISGFWVNDGFEDCEDGSDENGDSNLQFLCDDESYVALEKYDDGFEDCEDGSDEINIDSALEQRENDLVEGMESGNWVSLVHFIDNDFNNNLSPGDKFSIATNASENGFIFELIYKPTNESIVSEVIDFTESD